MLKRIVAAALVALPVIAHAGAIDVQPTVAFLPAGKDFSSFTFQNNLGKDASFEVSVVVEEGLGANLKQTPSDDITVSPQIFTIPAGGTQVLRYAVKTPRKQKEELRYRVIASQLPDNEAPQNGLKVLFKLGLAVFLAPKEPSIELKKALEGDKLRVINSGNVTVNVQTLNATGCDQIEFAKFLRPSQSWAVPVTAAQHGCDYKAKTIDGLLPMKD